MTTRQVRQTNVNETAEIVKENLDTLLKPIELQLQQLFDLAQQSDRALRGNNGTIGVIARVDKLETMVKEMAEKLLGEEKLRAIIEDVIKKTQVETPSSKDRFTLKEIFSQVILPIAISGLSVFLFTYMPKIIQITADK